MKYLKYLSKESGFKLLILALSAGALSIGFVLQYIGFGGVKYKPCPLCILQRLLLLACLLISLLALMLPVWRRAWSLIIGAVAITGAGLASWQLWLQGKPSVSCGVDPIERLIEQYFLTDYTGWFFRVEAMCADKQPLFVGLEIPQWSIAVNLAVTMLCFGLWYRTK